MFTARIYQCATGGRIGSNWDGWIVYGKARGCGGSPPPPGVPFPVSSYPQSELASGSEPSALQSIPEIDLKESFVSAKLESGDSGEAVVVWDSLGSSSCSHLRCLNCQRVTLIHCLVSCWLCTGFQCFPYCLYRESLKVPRNMKMGFMAQWQFCKLGVVQAWFILAVGWEWSGNRTMSD